MKNFKYIFCIALTLLASRSHATIITVNDEETYNQQVLQNSRCCVVKFAADWCGVCKGVKEPFEAIADEDEFKDVSFVQVNIDQAADLSKKQGIIGVPTFIYVAQGTTVDQEVGVQDMDKFQENMRNNIRKNFANKPAGEQVQETKKETLPSQDISPMEKVEEKTAGIVETIVNLIKQLIDIIFGLIKYTVDAVKGLFGR